MLSGHDYHERLLHPLGRVTTDMETHGVPFDRPAAVALLERVTADVARTQSALAEWCADVDYVGPEVPPNWGSWQQLQYFLYTPLGLGLNPSPYWKKGATGYDAETGEAVSPEAELKTDDKALEWLASAHPEHAHGLGLISELRWQQRVAAYLDKWIGLCVAHDGWHWLHPSYGLASDFDDRAGARTGRFAVKNPALQQIPQHQDDYGLRSLFRAPPGYLMIEIDAMQLEVVILAHVCHRLFGTRGLLDRVAPGMPDMHSSTAKFVFGEIMGNVRLRDMPVDRVKTDAEHERFLIKAVRYGNAYMKGDRTTGETLFGADGKAIGEDGARRLREGLFSFDPEIPMYHDWCRDIAPRWGGAVSLLGRWSPLPDARSPRKGLRNRAVRQLSNYVMQAGGQEITGLGMIACHGDTVLRRLGARLCLQVHDSLVFMVPAANAGAALERATSLLYGAVTLDAHLGWDGKVGPSLKETH